LGVVVGSKLDPLGEPGLTVEGETGSGKSSELLQVLVLLSLVLCPAPESFCRAKCEKKHSLEQRGLTGRVLVCEEEAADESKESGALHACAPLETAHHITVGSVCIRCSMPKALLDAVCDDVHQRAKTAGMPSVALAQVR
jgi:hypothetical protein